MNENLLLKIALICSLVGLAALYFISSKVQIPDYDVGSEIGDDVKIKGKITKISGKGELIVLDVEQATTIQAVIFSDENFSFNKGDDVEIIGELQKYKGDKQLVVNRIRVVE